MSKVARMEGIANLARRKAAQADGPSILTSIQYSEVPTFQYSRSVPLSTVLTWFGRQAIDAQPGDVFARLHQAAGAILMSLYQVYFSLGGSWEVLARKCRRRDVPLVLARLFGAVKILRTRLVLKRCHRPRYGRPSESSGIVLCTRSWRVCQHTPGDDGPDRTENRNQVGGNVCYCMCV